MARCPKTAAEAWKRNLFAMAEHINSTFAENRVRQAGHRNARIEGASPVLFSESQ
jgi:hypothetical protein